VGGQGEGEGLTWFCREVHVVVISGIVIRGTALPCKV
jgi:hypothetical protein